MRAGRVHCTNSIDIDNCVKTIQDAINGVVFLDDRQVISVIGKKAWADTGSALVKVTHIGGGDGDV